MPRFALSLPQELHKKMRRHPEIAWSEVIRRILWEKIRDLDMMEQIAAKGKRGLTPEEIDELDHMVKRAALQRIERKGLRGDGTRF